MRAGGGKGGLKAVVGNVDGGGQRDCGWVVERRGIRGTRKQI